MPENKRTEDDIVTQSPLIVILGGKKYEIKLLPIKLSRQWRKEVAEVISSLPQYANVTTDNLDQFGAAISQMLSGMPDKIIDLFFGYAIDLDREEIEEVANDVELSSAFDKVVDIGFPLAGSLVRTMTRLSQ